MEAYTVWRRFALTALFSVPYWRLQRLAKDLSKHLQMHDGCSLGNNKVSALDRTLGEISRILEKEVLWLLLNLSADTHLALGKLYICIEYYSRSFQVSKRIWKEFS